MFGLSIPIPYALVATSVVILLFLNAAAFSFFVWLHGDSAAPSSGSPPL